MASARCGGKRVAAGVAVSRSAYGTAMDTSIGRAGALRLTVIRGDKTQVRQCAVCGSRSSWSTSAPGCVGEQATLLDVADAVCQGGSAAGPSLGWPSWPRALLMP